MLQRGGAETPLQFKTRIDNVCRKAVRLKWYRAGHICCMHPEMWAHIATQWVPQESCWRGGRLMRRSQDDLEALLNYELDIALLCLLLTAYIYSRYCYIQLFLNYRFD